MNPETRFVFEWLAAHVNFYELQDVTWISHDVQDGTREIFTDKTTQAVFHGIGKKCSGTIRFNCYYPVSLASVFRALIEVGNVLGVKHNVSDDNIRKAVGTKTPMELLLEQT